MKYNFHFILAQLAYQACVESQKHPIISKSEPGNLLFISKNCSVQFMKYTDFIAQESLEELIDYEGCNDVTTISCTCSNEDCANQFLRQSFDRLQEASAENVENADNPLSLFVIIFVIVTSFVLSVFIFVLICLLIKYCLWPNPNEFYL